MTAQLTDRYPLAGANPTPAARAEHRAQLAQLAAVTAAGLADLGEYDAAAAYLAAAEDLAG